MKVGFSVWKSLNAGIEYLREYLNLPVEVVPETLKPSKAQPMRPPRFQNEDRPRRQQDDYRRSEKKTGAEGDFKPEFVSIVTGMIHLTVAWRSRPWSTSSISLSSC